MWSKQEINLSTKQTKWISTKSHVCKRNCCRDYDLLTDMIHNDCMGAFSDFVLAPQKGTKNWWNCDCYSGGNGSSSFSIDSNTCDVTVAQQLDYETAAEYDVIIEVKDLDPVSPRSATGTFTVQVLDANENAPVGTSDALCSTTVRCFTVPIKCCAVSYTHLTLPTNHRV